MHKLEQITIASPILSGMKIEHRRKRRVQRLFERISVQPTINLTEETKGKRINRARKGGEARARRYIPLKLLMTEILTQKTPTLGWSSYVGAARILTKELEQNHDEAIEAS